MDALVARLRFLTAPIAWGGRARVRQWSPQRTGIGLVLSIGVLLFAAAGVTDVVYHLLPEAQASLLLGILGPEARLAHLATMAGMLLVLAGVIHRGITASRLRQRAATTHPNGASFAASSTHSKEA